MTFSEFVRFQGMYISTHNRDTDIYKDYDIDILLQEYNTYLQKEQNKHPTSEFLLGLGFEDEDDFSCFKTKTKNKKCILEISFLFEWCNLRNNLDNEIIEIPFPKTQKDVTDLMRLLDID